MRDLKSRWQTDSGIELKGFCRPDGEARTDLPGDYPYTRGIQPTMYRGRLWTMRQYAGFGSAAETNRRFKYLLAHGQTGLSVAFDLPTQMGLDSDHALAAGEVGKVGVAIDTLHDMETVFEGIPLDKVSTSMTINATAAILLAMYIAVAKKQGLSPLVINGTVQNDILKEYIARGNSVCASPLGLENPSNSIPESVSDLDFKSRMTLDYRSYINHYSSINFQFSSGALLLSQRADPP